VPDTIWGGIIYSLAPTILVGLIFWFIMRAVIRADRTERKVYSEIEAEERAKLDSKIPRK
jgi:flagellar biosynthesis/type III secretory pathway M-ring protein FliF/YscJ